MGAPCRKYDLELRNALAEGIGKEWNDHYKCMLDYINNITGMGIKDIVTMTYLYGDIFIEVLNLDIRIIETAMYLKVC